MSTLPPYDPHTDPLMQTMGFVRLIDSDAEAGRVAVEFEANLLCERGQNALVFGAAE